MDAALSALVIHDLKNRLVVQGRRLAAVRRNHPELEAALEPIENEARALQHRLIAFLTLYRSEALGLATSDQEERPAQTLEQVAASARGLAEGRAVEIEVEAAQAPEYGFYDAYLVGLALESAVDNALRFAHSRVRLSAREEDAWLVFAVLDDGPGLGADKTVTNDTTQTGLGTALCQAVARLHQCEGRAGHVRLIEGGIDGVGARFELYLP